MIQKIRKLVRDNWRRAVFIFLTGTFCLIVVAIIAYAFGLHFLFKRTIVLDVETGSLEVTLTSELNGKAFRELWICERRIGDEKEPKTKPPISIGCPRSHILTDGPLLFETPTVPSGSTLLITSSQAMVRIDVTGMPKRYEGTNVGRLVGGALIVFRDDLDTFGTLPLQGMIRIGAAFAETDRLSTISGRYQVRGATPWSLIDGDMRVLRSGELLAGALTRFTTYDNKTASGRVVIVLPDPESPLMRVTAISEHALNYLGIQYYTTDESKIGPSWIEALLIDPAVQILVALLGAITGYGWVRELVGERGRKSKG